MEDLDYHFLRYIGVTREGQRRIHAFYLPFFQGCHRVVDLGCGEGHFVEMLEETGLEAVGVDRDSQCCRAASQRGIRVICQDVFDYLRGTGEGEVDGIFSSHLVEHLPFQEVLDLLSLCHRALAPGGTIVLTTPNVRSLFSHLEMFYMHFGHISFYHPNLLCFFLDYTGYSEVEMGENPETSFPLWGHPMPRPSREPGPSISPIRYDPLLPVPPNPLRKLMWLGKMFLVKLIVQPYVDRIVREVNAGLKQVEAGLGHLDAALEQERAALEQANARLERLDRPFECYARGRKPG